MTIPEKAVEWAVGIARDDSHGYDQGSRWGPDYDCSSLVISAYKAAGVPLQSTYTGNMRNDFFNHGFAIPVGVNLATGAGLQVGDVLLNEQHHTALYIGNGQLVHASGNEWGGATGGQTGDQTGKEISITGYFNFPWDFALRYVAAEPVDPPQPDPSYDDGGEYVVQKGDTLWGIAERLLGDGSMYVLIMTANHLTGSTIYPGQVLVIPGKGTPKKKVTISCEIDPETYQLLQIIMDGWHLTMGEAIDKILEDAR